MCAFPFEYGLETTGGTIVIKETFFHLPVVDVVNACGGEWEGDSNIPRSQAAVSL